MMSMKSEGKPVSFVEDCAVQLTDLAEYTRRLTEIFHKHGTDGTWYAHASVGTLHVRPVLNLKLDQDVKAMRAIAEEAFAMVRSEEPTSELQSLMRISYAVFCLKKKKTKHSKHDPHNTILEGNTLISY